MLRLGLVDFDSSHSVEFTRRFQHAGVDRDQCVDGARVVLGCPGSSLMAPERIAGFTQELKTLDIPLMDEPEELIGEVDAVLILSLCGAAHLERARPFIEARVPVFVDKPFACSVADAEVMVRLAAEYGSFLMNASAMRFNEELLNFKARLPAGRVLGAVTWGPAKRAEGNPGLFHYGIHAVEMLLELMGPDCVRLSCSHSDSCDVVTGHWHDGRIGTVRGNRAGSTAYGFTAYCERGVISISTSTRFAYRNLCRALVESFSTGVPAVSPDSSLETVRFISAASRSEAESGRFIALSDITD